MSAPKHQLINLISKLRTDNNIDLKNSAKQISKSIDFVISNNCYFCVFDKSDEALDHMMQVAAEAEHPRAFEVLAGMFKTSADMTTQLIDLQKKRHELDKLNNEPTQSGVTNNNLFVGSTTELQKMLTKRNDND